MAQTNVQAFSGDVAISSNFTAANSKFSLDTNGTLKQDGNSNSNYIKLMKYFGNNASNWKIATGSYTEAATYQWFSIRAKMARLDRDVEIIQFNYLAHNGTSRVRDPIIIGGGITSSQANEIKVYNKTGDSTYEIYLQIDDNTSVEVEISHRNSTIDDDYSTVTTGAIDETGLTKIYDSGTTADLRLKEGNVGIGKTDPGSALDVVGDVAISSNLAVDTNTLFVDSVGNKVGIGTTNPDYTLDVQGATGFDKLTTLRILNPSSQYGRNQLHLVGRYEGNNDAFAATSARNAIMFKSQSGLDSAITNRWTIQSFPNGTNNDLGFMADTNNTPKVMFRGINGHVGIGITSPTYKLHVNGSLFYSSGGLNGSDDRIKYNEENITNALDIICKLKPQKYEKIMTFPSDATGSWIPTDENWETVKNAETKPWEGFTHGDEYGFIAQDVRNIPEVSFLVSGSEMKTVDESVSPEEYVNLNEDEQGTYTRKYVYEENVITIEEYTNLISENKDKCTGIYIKQVETQTPLGLNYQGIFVVAVKAIQEIDAQLQAEKVRNDALEARILALESA